MLLQVRLPYQMEDLLLPLQVPDVLPRVQVLRLRL
jgi:hypothetical protein